MTSLLGFQKGSRATSVTAYVNKWWNVNRHSSVTSKHMAEYHTTESPLSANTHGVVNVTSLQVESFLS